MTKNEFITAKTYVNSHGLCLDNNGEVHMLIPFSEREWITKSILEIYKAAKQPKTVLEFGFGMGYTATQFQKLGIDKHIIVEPHPKIFRSAQRWARQYNNVEIVNEFYQDYQSNEMWDLIYNDIYFFNDDQVSFDEDKFSYRYYSQFCDWRSDVIIEPPSFLRDGFWWNDGKFFRYQPIKASV